MVISQRKRGFTLVELLVVIMIIGILAALALSAVMAAMEASNRMGCQSNARQVAVGVFNYASNGKRFPLASKQSKIFNRGSEVGTLISKPGDPTTAGFSWIAQVLDEIGSETIADEVAEVYGNLNEGPFASNLDYNVHPATRTIPILNCPSFEKTRVSEDGLIDETDPYALGELPAISNYICLPATDWGRVSVSSTSQNKSDENGILVSQAGGSTVNGSARGISLQGVTDGLSETILFCETREPLIAAWIDGSSTWAVAVRPSVDSSQIVESQATGYLEYTGTENADAMQFGPAQSDSPADRDYFTEGAQPAFPVKRAWGPSSFHSRGAIVHAYGDGRADFLFPDDIDVSVYMQMVTRDGGETVER